MEPTYSEWKNAVNANNQIRRIYCPYCERPTANITIRYKTNRDGETERQYRVACPICEHKGKTYLHESIAEMSWSARENDPEKDEFPENNRKRYFGKGATKSGYYPGSGYSHE